MRDAKPRRSRKALEYMCAIVLKRATGIEIDAVRVEAIDRTPEGRNWTVTTVIPRPPLRWNNCRVVERTLAPWQDRFDLDPKS
jgi:hypothetical protein